MLIRLLENHQHRFRAVKETINLTTPAQSPTSSFDIHPVDDELVDIVTVILSSVVCLIFVVSLVSNALVLVVIGRTRRLHRMNNALIVSLVVADTVRTVVVMPTYVLLTLTDVSKTHAWTCEFYDIALSCCDVIVVMNSVFIGVERAFVISKPLEYQRIVTRTKMAAFVATLWIFCAIYGGLQSFRYVIFSVEDSNVTDTIKSPLSSADANDCRTVQPSVAFAAFDFAFTFCASFVVIVLAYGKIVFVVRSQMKRIMPTLHSDAYANSEYTAPNPDNRTSGRETSVSRRDSVAGQADWYIERSHLGVSNPARIVTVSSQERITSENTLGATTHKEMLQRIQEDVDFDPQCAQLDDKSNRRISVISSPGMMSQPRVGPGRRASNLTHYNNVTDVHRSTSGVHSTRGLNASSKVTSNNADERLKELPITLPISHHSPQPTRQPPKRRRSSVTFNLNQNENALESPHSNEVRAHSVPKESAENSAQKESTREAQKHLTRSLDEKMACVENEDDILKLDRCLDSKPRTGSQTCSTVSSDGTSSTYVSSSGGGGNPHRSSQGSFATTRSSVTVTSRRDSIVTQLNRNKAFKMTSVVVGTFVVGWLPFSLVQLLLVVSPSLISELTWDILQVCAFLVSAVNPFVYSFYSAEFRWSVKRLMTCDTDKPDMPWA